MVNHLIHVAEATTVGALAGSVVGPLGTTGGALTGFLSAVGCKGVSYVEARALNNSDKNEVSRGATHKTTATALSLFVVLASAIVAGSIVSAPISFTGVIATGIVACLIWKVAEPVDQLFRDAFFPLEA